jgi:hypothetical protein
MIRANELRRRYGQRDEKNIQYFNQKILKDPEDTKYNTQTE